MPGVWWYTWRTLPSNFGLNDKNYAQMQIRWAMQRLGYPVWGLSPSSTPDNTGNYRTFGAAGPLQPQGLASNRPCCPYDEWAVTPHTSFLALDVLPQQAFANIQKLRTCYPGLYGPYSFFAAVAMANHTYTANGTSYTVKARQIGHRYLVLDQSMIMAALDSALNNRAMQRHFVADPVISAAKPYLALERFSR